MISKIVILGAGKSGVGAAILGKKKGYDVFISDKKEIDENLKDFFHLFFFKNHLKPLVTLTNRRPCCQPIVYC